MDRLIIAIDGPAGSGKSSVARRVAEELGISDINTGEAYRAVAMLALDENAPLDSGPELSTLATRVALSGEGALVDGVPVSKERLRTPEVSAAASKVSTYPEVRQVLLSIQREAARRADEDGGAVVEGRDIGTVVLPEADLKVFLSASAEERARRRASQSGRGGELDRILEAMRLRDRQDSERETAPLKSAPDAVVLDTTDLSLGEVVAEIVRLSRKVSKGA